MLYDMMLGGLPEGWVEQVSHRLIPYLVNLVSAKTLFRIWQTLFLTRMGGAAYPHDLRHLLQRLGFSDDGEVLACCSCMGILC